jgi:hypothetical protein
MRGSHRETHLPQWLDTAASEVAAAAPLALFPVKAAAPAAWSLQVACVALGSRGECKFVSEMAQVGSFYRTCSALSSILRRTYEASARVLCGG